MMRYVERKRWWILGAGIVIASWAVLHQVQFGKAQEPPASKKKANKAHPSTSPTDRSRAKVVVVKPHKGGIERSTTQPGTMESFDFADLYAKVSGYVKEQSVDIGDQVTAGKVLLEIDAPEFDEALHEAQAAEAQAEAQVIQMKSRVKTAEAEFDAAESNITLVEANLGKAESYLKFREIQYKRISELFKRNSIDERLVDEKHEERDTAEAGMNAAKAAILSAKSQSLAAKARVAAAEADVIDAQAQVRLAKSRVSRAQVFVNYTKIVSPYNGVVTRRSFHVGDFIRAADQGGAIPLLTVARTDWMRVVVQVPEREIAYTNRGDKATVELDGIAGVKFHGEVSRIAQSEDRMTRSMRTEIDLENTQKQLRDGMFGRVTIVLSEAPKGLTIPSSSLVSSSNSKKPAVFVIRDGKLQLQPVEVGQDDGIRAEILSGLTPDDRVVARPGSDLSNGMAVETEEVALAGDAAEKA
jgi:RND family efflux transporter MFP subunit